MRRFCFFSLLLAFSANLVFSQAMVIDTPLATVKLTKVEVISVRQFKADVERYEKTSGTSMTPEMKRTYLDSKINDILFLQMCERDKIIVSEGEITAQVSSMKASLGPSATDAQFEQALRAQGIQLSDIRTYVKQQLLMQRFIAAKKQSDPNALKEPSADEILKAYELYKSQFVRPDSVRISVLFIETRTMTPENKKKAVDTIRAMVSVLRSAPGKFDEYLLRGAAPDSGYKVSASAIIGRTPDFLRAYGQLFMDVVFKLKDGEVSELIENESGVQVVRINDIYPQKQLTLSDPIQVGQAGTIQDFLKNKLLEQKFVLLTQNLLVALRKEATIKIFEENLK